jgi:hypothetical protein
VGLFSGTALGSMSAAKTDRGKDTIISIAKPANIIDLKVMPTS